MLFHRTAASALLFLLAAAPCALADGLKNQGGRQPASTAPAKSASAAEPAAKGGVPIPSGLDPKYAADVAAGKNAEHTLSAFLGIPYRIGGLVNDQGKYAVFADLDTELPSPGLNCSGFVLAASRLLLHSNIPVDEARRDTLGDSAPGSALGEDWDFGWDIIVNTPQDRPKSVLLPGGIAKDPAGMSGLERGFDIHAPATWKELPARLRPGHVYLVSFSKPSTLPGYTLQHYHVGIILPVNEREIWFYHTTGKGAKVNRRNIASPDGRASFLRAFANTGTARKMLAVVEVELPKDR